VVVFGGVAGGEVMEEKIIAGLNESSWKERYIAYMKKHSNAEDWQCDESSSVAWDESTDETPEECAEEELSNWD
jgi:hypothetical protein